MNAVGHIINSHHEGAKLSLLLAYAKDNFVSVGYENDSVMLSLITIDEIADTNFKEVELTKESLLEAIINY